MEGGNKFNINLEAPLDTNSNDMLVPVSQPTVLHNWQKFQGKYMPNSLRFEKNGWAADWNVFNFEYVANERIQLASDLYVAAINLDTLGFYSSETSRTLINTLMFNRDYILKYKSSESVEFNSADGTITGLDYTVTWNPATEEATLNTEEDKSLVYTWNDDNSITFNIINNEQSFEFDADIYLPKQIASDSLMSPINYDKYEGGIDYWDSGYSYNRLSNVLTVPYNIGTSQVPSYTLQPTVTDNRLDFGFVYNNSSDVLQLIFDFHDYLLSLSNPSTETQYETEEQTTNLLINSFADPLYSLNIFSVDYNPCTLDTSNSMDIDIKIPVYLTIKCTYKTDSSVTAKYADNVSAGNIQIGTGARNTIVTVTSVYDDVAVTTDSEQVSWVSPSESKRLGYFPVSANYRFNKVEVHNTIHPTDDYSPYKYNIVGNNVWLFNALKFPVLSSTASKRKLSALLGNIYDIKNFYTSSSNLVEYNNIFDYKDNNSVLYTQQDIEDYRSIKVKGASDTADTVPDFDYLDNVVFSSTNNETFCTDYCVELTASSPTIYNPSDIAKTLANLYQTVNGDRTYIGGTYLAVSKTLSYDDSFWPFEYIPCFNYTDGVNTVQGVLYVRPDGTYITDFDEYKEEMLGQYNYSSTYDIKNEILVSNQFYSRARLVKNYKVVYDFDTSNNLEFLTDWDKWYPGITSPAEMYLDTNVQDITYLDYTNITFITDVEPGLKYSIPGISLTGGSSLNVFNADGIIIYDSSLVDNSSVAVYHQNIDSTNLYNLTVTNTHGKLTVNSVDYPLYTFYEQGANDHGGVYYPKSRFLTKVTRDVDKFTISTYQVTTVYSGLLNATIEPKQTTVTAHKEWINGVTLRAYDGMTTVNSLALPTGPEDRGNWITGNVYDGIIFTQAFDAHARGTLSYTTVTDIEDINDSSTVFTFVKTPDSNISATDKQKIFIDRDLNRSFDNFDFLLSSLNFNNLEQGKIAFSLAPKNSGVVYYLPDTGTENPNSISPLIPLVSVMNTLEASEQPVTFNSVFTLTTRGIPADCTIILKKGEDINHIFYTENFDSLTMNSKATINNNVQNYTSQITISIAGSNLTMTYDAETKALSSSGIASIQFIDTVVSIPAFTNMQAVDNAFNITINEALSFANVHCNFIDMHDDDCELMSCDENVCIIKYTEKDIAFDYNIQTQSSNKYPKVRVTRLGNYAQNIYITSEVKDIVVAKMVTVVDNHVLYNGYDIDLSLLSFDNIVTVLSTDIRTSDKTKAIGKIKGENEFQLIRQQWNSTVEVDNFWWIDSEHILELNQYDFVYKRKTDELDDWNGDRFEDVYILTRSEILSTNIRKYLVSNCYNTERDAIFLTAELVDGIVVCKLYDIRNKFDVLYTFSIQFDRCELGTAMNTKLPEDDTVYFSTYNLGLQENQLLAKADWSCSIVEDYMIIGCHLMNGYDQWSIVIRLTDMAITKCIQGYGYVGLKGDLTGGQIPSDFFDENLGFVTPDADAGGIVWPLDTLPKVVNKESADKDYEISDINDLYNIDTKVVGTAEQQWYISTRVHGIVSHLSYEGNGQFKKEIIPITNNYSAIYKSPSFISEVMGDNAPTVFNLVDIINSGGQKVVKGVLEFVLNCITTPIIMYCPRLSSLIYLQQTLGQYAYVHYNSYRERTRKELQSTDLLDKTINEKNTQTINPVLYDDYTFDKQIVKQKGMINGAINTALGLLFSAGAATAEVTDKISANLEQAQVAVDDVGKKYSQFALENIAGLFSTSIRTYGKDCGLTSYVVGIKNLDMFYSTSDTQRVFAGPGFVEHQFIADCVAQSATDLHVNGRQLQMTMVLKEITLKIIDLKIWVEQLIYEIACSSIGSSSKIISALAVTAAGVSAAVLEKNKIARDILDGILTKLTKDIRTVTSTNPLAYDIPSYEGSHKYGEKLEEFMWPCWGIPNEGIVYNDEFVEAVIKEGTWELPFNANKYYKLNTKFANLMYSDIPKFSSAKPPVGLKYNDVITNHLGSVAVYQAACLGKVNKEYLPKNMAKVEGVESFLSGQPFKNENIGMSEPAFVPSLHQDYIIDENWQLAQYCTYGLQQWVTVKDTKIINCAPSNMYITKEFCGVACPYTAVEVKHGISKDYMRPWAVTPNTLAYNVTGYNCIHDNKLYHGFDGISYRLVEWVGSPGLNKSYNTQEYSFQANDRLKRSNKLPPNQLLGNFKSDPIQAVNSIDKLYTIITVPSEIDTNDTVGRGMEGGVAGEDKDDLRFSIPMFTEQVNTLPAAVKTLTANQLLVIDGLTSLTVGLENNQINYKAPVSVDFTIGKNTYRMTKDYISSINTSNEGVDVITKITPTLGLEFIGSTPTEAFFYSKATRCYYLFSGTVLTKIDMMERFRNVRGGHYDFVNQEVIMPCQMTYVRLNPKVKDTDTETDNIIVPILAQQHVRGELPPPITTIFNDKSWYKCVSLPCGFAYQGPNRVIINRSIFVDYMLDDMKDNLGKWKRVDKNEYSTNRYYQENYSDVLTDVNGINGWTYNQFVFVTSAVGLEETMDNLFEWEITFCWPIEMDKLYGVDNFAVVCIAADTMLPGGMKSSKTTHIYLTKELFTRTGNYGYYSFKFQSKNGIGNRERLKIWSDQYIAISSISCEIKTMTPNRTEQLTQQIDVTRLAEL